MIFHTSEISIKSEPQIQCLSRTAEILYSLFSKLTSKVVPGYNGLDVQDYALRYLESKGATPSLMGFKGFQADISISINEVAAHGLPQADSFKPGDLVTVDCAIVYQGWHGDMAWTYALPPITTRIRRLITAAWQSCVEGCRALRVDTTMGTLGSRVVNAAQRLGGHIVNEFCGHGIGRSLHELPHIPYMDRQGEGWKARNGMVLNIEPVVTLGNPEIISFDGDSSYVTVDGQPTAQYELTCVVENDSVRILSLPDLCIENILEYPPFF